MTQSLLRKVVLLMVWTVLALVPQQADAITTSSFFPGETSGYQEAVGTRDVYSAGNAAWNPAYMAYTGLYSAYADVGLRPGNLGSNLGVLDRTLAGVEGAFGVLGTVGTALGIQQMGSMALKSVKSAFSSLLGSAKSASKNASQILGTTTKQLQKKFKHASDFGVTGNFNKANAAKFNSAINQHINSSNVKAIQGTYRGNPVTHHVDPQTGLNVISDQSGNFVSGWKLSPQQLQHVLNGGKLGGG